MERPWKSRKHPLFVLLILTGLLTAVVFSYAASTIAKGVKESVEIHWIPYYTITLSIVSIIYITLSIALFNALPLRKVSCCSMFTFTTLFLGVAWTLSTVAQIFEEPNNKIYSPTDSKPPMLKIRAILSGAVAIAMFSSAFLSSLHHTLNDPTPGGKDSPSQLECSIGSRSHTQSSTSQRHSSREPTPLPSFHFEPISYPGPAELDSHPVETSGSVRGGNTEKGQSDDAVLALDSPRR